MTATAWTRVYDVAVLDPLADQLTGLAGIGAGMHVLDVLAGGGRLTRRLVGCVGPLGRVTAVEDSDGGGELSGELHAARVDAEVTDASPDALPFADGSFDAALSLCGISAARGGVAALQEMARVARRVVVLAARRGVLEDALLEALRATAVNPRTQLLAAWEPPPLPVDWAAHGISDVARFDSVAQLWHALCAHARLSLSLSSDQELAAAASLATALAAYASPDGTLRVPVQATVMQTGG